MLSVRGRDDRGRVLGFVGRKAMEVGDCEEGEVCSGAWDDAFVDPDVDFSYIDEKLQNVLGHFEKDFQGIICAENLGAKFGSYGSFLPAYQRSPSVQCQPSPPEVTKLNKLSKGEHQSLPVKASAVSENNILSTAQPLKISGETDKGIDSQVLPSDCTNNNKPVSNGELKSLKLRIKLTRDNTSARNNADIYSGLGLDLSPFSSPEDSPDSITGVSPELQRSCCESPLTILETMACFPFLGELWLSPLPNSLLLLSEKRGPYLKSCGMGTICKAIPDACAFLPDLISPTRELKGHKEKKTRSILNKRNLLDVKNSSCKDNMNIPLKTEISIETPAGRDLISTALNIPLVTEKAEPGREFLSNASGLSALSNLEIVDGEKKIETIGDSVKHSIRMPDHARDLNQASAKSSLSLPMEMKENIYGMTGSVKSNGFILLGNEDMQLKGKPCSKTSLSEKEIKDRQVGLQLKTSHDLQQEGKNKSENDYAKVKVSSDALKGKKGNLTNSVVHDKKKPVEHSAPHDHDKEKKLHHKDLQSEVERKSKGGQSNRTISTVLFKDDRRLLQSTSSKEKKISSQTRVNCFANDPKALKSHKKLSKSLGDDFLRNGPGAGLLKDQFKHKLKETKLEVDKYKEIPSGESGASIMVPTVTSLTPALTSDAVAANNSKMLTSYKKLSKNLGADFHGDGLGKETKLEVKKSKKISSGKSEASVKVLAVASLTYTPTSDAVAFLTSAPTSHAVAANNSKVLKFHKKSSKSEGEVHGDGLANLEAEQLYNEAALLKKQFKSKLKETKFEPGKPEGMPSGKSEASVEVPAVAPLTSASTPDAVAVPNETAVIEDKWVCCDKCQKWRLLPYDTNLDDLPKKWKCHMQTWLPGLNKCSASQEETEKAFHALHQVSLLVNSSNPNGHSAVTTSALVIAQNLPTNDPVKNRQLSVKGKCFNNANAVPLELDSFNRADFEQISNTSDFTVQKRQHKEKMGYTRFRHSYDQANSIPQSGTCLKIKSKRELDGDSSGISKKIKIHGSCYLENRLSDLNVAGMSGNLLPIEGKNSQKYKDNPYNVDSRCDSKDKKKSKSQIQIMSDGEQKENFSTSDFERVDPLNFASKKRKLKDRPESLSNQETIVSSHQYRNDRAIYKENFSEPELRKEKKSRVLKFEGMKSGSSEAGGIMHKKGGMTRILLSGGRKQLTDGIDRSTSATSRDHDEVQQGQHGNDCLQRDIANARHSKAATSSSSKVSSSCKSKSNFQETRGSPIGSVSSSPLTISKSERLTARRYSVGKNDSTNLLNDDAVGGFSGCLNDEFDATNDKSGSRKMEKPSSVLFKSPVDDKTAESDDCSSLRGTCDPDKVTKELPVSKPRARIHLKSSRSTQQNILSTEFEETKLVNGSANALDQHIPDMDSARDQERVNNCLTKDELRQLRSGKNSPFFVGRQGISELASYRSKDKLVDKDNSGKSSILLSDCIDQSKTTPGRGRQVSLLPTQDTQETQWGGSYPLDTPQQKNKSDEFPRNAAKSAAPNEIRRPRKSKDQIVSHYSSPRHPTYDRLDVQSPTIKQNQLDASAVLKEARYFKNTADRLKDEGLELESSDMYFQAALIFLHVGSLWEPSSTDMNKYEEAHQSMRMYIVTARQCEFCAHVYEKHKDMARAALAYKCMEVAYFKVAYLKHPIVSKDWHGLQAALQIVLPGESPSSSASDVDNVNNQSTLHEAASAKGASSQSSGDHVIPARYCPIYTRWLNYTNETLLAFEASRKSQNAFAGLVVTAASLAQERNTMACVQKALDLNFHNVEELLRLIRLFPESISS